MNITRHNYEEYFLLYLDNELGEQEKRQVEEFVQRHPDLKEELGALQQFKLVPDNSIQFDGKEELLKENGVSRVTETNYTEWFSLYIDDELSPAEKKQVERFLASTPTAAAELEIWQRSKLQPESVPFPGKASLYRSAEKVHALPVKWWRWAAAAVLLIGVGIGTATLLRQRNDNENALVKQSPETPAKTPAGPVENTPLPAIKVQESPLALSNDIPATSPVRSPEVSSNGSTAKQVPLRNAKQVNNPAVQPEKKEEAVVAANNKRGNDLPQPVFNPNVMNTDAVEKAVTASVTPKEITTTQDALTNPVVTTKTPQPSDIVFASDKTSDAGFEQADGKKNKSRGLFRKIARTFEKRTNIDATDEDRLLIAGLSIKLK